MFLPTCHRHCLWRRCAECYHLVGKICTIIMCRTVSKWDMPIISEHSLWQPASSCWQHSICDLLTVGKCCDCACVLECYRTQTVVWCSALKCIASTSTNRTSVADLQMITQMITVSCVLCCAVLCCVSLICSTDQCYGLTVERNGHICKASTPNLLHRSAVHTGMVRVIRRTCVCEQGVSCTSSWWVAIKLC